VVSTNTTAHASDRDLAVGIRLPSVLGAGLSLPAGRVSQFCEHIARREPRLTLRPPIQPRVGDQAVDGVSGGEVGLHQAMKEPVVLPRPLAEPAIALARVSV
jgi:hypothetical protein